MDQHWDEQADQQQQCNGQENNQQLACVSGRVVMPLFHMTFLSLVESQQTLFRHPVEPASEDWQDRVTGGTHW